MDRFAILNAASDLGDSAVMSAVAVVAAIQLAWSGYRRVALVLIAALVAAAAVIGLLKVAFVGCGAGAFAPRLNSPSGHAAMTAAVLGTLSFVVQARLTGWWRLLLPPVALAAIGAIAATRVALGMHTTEEVIVGLAAGALVALLAIAALRRAEMGRVRLGQLLLAIAVTAALTDGVRAPTEEVVHYFAALVHRNIPLCAGSYARADATRGLPATLRNE